MSGTWHYGLLRPVIFKNGTKGWAAGSIPVKAGDEIGLPWPDGDHWYTVLAVKSRTGEGIVLADRRFRLSGWSGWEVRIKTGGDI